MRYATLNLSRMKHDRRSKLRWVLLSCCAAKFSSRDPKMGTSLSQSFEALAIARARCGMPNTPPNIAPNSAPSAMILHCTPSCYTRDTNFEKL